MKKLDLLQECSSWTSAVRYLLPLEAFMDDFQHSRGQKGNTAPSSWCRSALRPPDHVLPCGTNPLVLLAFPSFMFSATAKQEKIVGAALDSAIVGFSVSLMGATCFLLGAGVLPFLHVALWPRWFLSSFMQGRFETGQTCLVGQPSSSCLYILCVSSVIT